MTRLTVGIIPLTLGVAALVLVGCDTGPQLADTEPPVVTVSQPLVQDDVVDYLQFTGRIEAAETVDVRARVRGELTKIEFKDGALVHEGDLLFEIDPRPYQAALDVAKAKKANAEASKDLANAEYERNRVLYNTNAASARDVEAWLAKKNIAAAEINQANAEIDRAKLDVEFTQIKAPITGRISRALVTKGNLINSGGGDTLLTTIVSVDPIYVYFDVDEKTLKDYRKQRTKEAGAGWFDKEPDIDVLLSLIGEGDRISGKGKIDFAENKINPATGTIRVRGKFRNEDGQLTPGQFARVRLPDGKKYEGLLITDAAVGTDQGKKYVLVVTKDPKTNEDKVEYRPVTPGREEGDLRVFKPDSGLKKGEWVIVNGVQRVRPGITVKPEQVTMPTRTNGDKAGAE
jgi:RND family efflux transporter MFP subunit